MSPPLAEEVAAGIHRIAVPTPFAVGSVNCYVLSGNPLTLVDTGPNSGTSLDHLERALSELGLRVEEIELIVLTHQHMDHLGLVEVLARRSGADVAAYAPLVPWLADYSASARADDAYAQEMMRRHGVRDEINMVLALIASGMHAFGSSAAVTVPLQDGGALTMGSRRYSVHHRPGHSPSDLVFDCAESGVLIGGDHLLAQISSNALVTRSFDADAGDARPAPLIAYSRSLRATRQMPARLILTGHGEAITDHRTLIDTRLADQDRRARRILSLIASEPLTAHQIAQRMWGEIAIKQAYLTLSEVLGHLDLLLDSGAATERESGGVSLFAAA